MKRENFRATASRAIDEGSRQRQMSAQRLASQFENGAAEFDLRSLERLGEAGLGAFLSNLGDHQNRFRTGGNQSLRDISSRPPFRRPEGITAGRCCEAASLNGSSERSCVEWLWALLSS